MKKEDLVIITENMMHFRDSFSVECLTIFTTKGKCLFSIENPTKDLKLEGLLEGLHILVLNLRGGYCATKLFSI